MPGISTVAAKLDAAVRAVAPILGVSGGRWDDKSTWRIDFTPEATAEQQRAAAVVVEGFDVAAVESAEAASQSAQETLATEARADQIFARLSNATGAQIATFINNTFPALNGQQRAVLTFLLHHAALSLRRGLA